MFGTSHIFLNNCYKDMTIKLCVQLYLSLRLAPTGYPKLVQLARLLLATLDTASLVVTLAASTIALALRPSAESDLVHWQTGLFNLC